VVTNRQELAMPPRLQAEQLKGFSLYVMRAVMNGRGDEIVDLAKSNLIR
jgi:pyruvate dehydrogenase (quinone)